MRRFTIRFRGWQDDRGNKVPRWCQNSELAANISAWIQLHPDADEENFARFCLDDLRNNLNSLAARHLSALLENIGYVKSEEIYHNLCKQNNSVQLPPEDSLDQIFQYAWLEAANPTKFFRNFKEQEPSLIGYTSSTMKTRINDQVFGKKYLTITYTGYGLLRKLGEGERKRKKILELQGYKNDRVSNLLLAWECFYQVCTPNRQHRIKPTSEHWQAITSQYNHLRKEHNPIVDCQTIQDWIDNYCIPAARNYVSPPIIYIDANNQETDEREIDIPDISLPPDEWLKQEEMKEIVRRLGTEFDFTNFLQNLKEKDKKLLLLRYGFELIQTDVAEEFNWHKNNRPDNSRVSKAEDRILRDLAKTIMNWIVTSKIPRMEEAVVIDSEWFKNMKIKFSCEILTKRYYFDLVKSFKDEVKNTLEPQLLELEGNNQLVNNQLTDRQQFLNNYVVNQIQTSFNITLQADGSVATKISSLLEDFLEMPQH